MHIWLINNWEKNLNWSNKNYRTGLRLKFDKDVDPEVKRSCKEFAIIIIIIVLQVVFFQFHMI